VAYVLLDETKIIDLGWL